MRSKIARILHGSFRLFGNPNLSEISYILNGYRATRLITPNENQTSSSCSMLREAQLLATSVPAID